MSNSKGGKSARREGFVRLQPRGYISVSTGLRQRMTPKSETASWTKERTSIRVATERRWN